MLWKNQRESNNVIDQRRSGVKTLGGGGLLVGAILVYLLGGNPLEFVAQNMHSVTTSAPVSESRDDEQKTFVSVVLASTEDVWNSIFEKKSRTYREPQLVLFRGVVDSACGRARQSTGPFYCPGDEKLYMDLSFLDELSETLGATGDFAGAYVVAHEVGHHIQQILGLLKGGSSVDTELQADCLAGVWSQRAEETKGLLEEGDIDEALGAAAAVGDDRLQKMSQGYVVSDSFTHGSSAQRVAAFNKGYMGGELDACLR